MSGCKKLVITTTKSVYNSIDKSRCEILNNGSDNKYRRKNFRNGAFCSNMQRLFLLQKIDLPTTFKISQQHLSLRKTFYIVYKLYYNNNDCKDFNNSFLFCLPVHRNDWENLHFLVFKQWHFFFHFLKHKFHEMWKDGELSVFRS